ncbi:MAG: methionine--tRNA ligase [Nitrososphaerota archaeon]|nr:methionine--tRNA ligase [Nitrososphaerota archaeon]MCL5672143.1 methionine--tRNA ligase [Nitrososphaerota archaeon]MDG6924425.1 methionine--tRNA ligase [Nitrososphaerota archaeon]MDG6941123.1 methionine--tRNA ligase [Nitrososphaerota archaeon]MDG6945706.1 methionine--tRNA ligase [Nitrososphaerota archaeon]
MPKEVRRERVLVLCALPYTNAVPHVGNLVGSHLPADIFARYCRLKGMDTLFVGATDENGTPTEVAALELGVTPKELTDTLYRVHRDIYQWFGISYDNFSRTSAPTHHKTSQEFFLKIYEKGYVSEGVLRLPYCEKDRLFLPDRYVEGTCPVCGYELARGDQCEKCSTLLDPIQLINPRCKVDGSPPVFKDSKQLFLELGKVHAVLQSWIGSNEVWKAQVTSLAMGWLKEGLKKRSITRDLRWGVPVPLDGYRSKVFYVWFDAPIGYISATKEWGDAKGDPEAWKKFWTDEGTRIYNFLGKDNIPFHTIFWPGMLFAHGGLNLPYDVVGLQFCNYEGDKISKSKNWGVFCESIPMAGLDPDIWRYYLIGIIPETRDTEFKWDDFKSKVNNELVANLGNFIHRTTTFAWNNFGGDVAVDAVAGDEQELLDHVARLGEESLALLGEVRFREAMTKLLAMADLGNEYFQGKQPWKLVKTEKEECGRVIHACLTACEYIAIVLQPFLPASSARILDLLGTRDRGLSGLGQRRSLVKLSGKPEVPFRKLEDEQLEAAKKLATKSRPVKDYFRG